MRHLLKIVRNEIGVRVLDIHQFDLKVEPNE